MVSIGVPTVEGVVVVEEEGAVVVEERAAVVVEVFAEEKIMVNHHL